MTYTPLRLKSSGNIEQENAQFIEGSFQAELNARVQDAFQYNSLQFGVNKIEDFNAALIDSEVLTPQQANQEYGIDGVLQFEGPVKRSEAQLKKTRILQNQDRKDFIAKQAKDEGALAKVGNAFIALGTVAADPVNLIPFGSLMKLNRLRQFTKLGRYTQAAIKGSADGVIGSIASTPLTVDNLNNIGEEYTALDAAYDIGFGAIGGAGFGALGKRIEASNIISKAQKRGKEIGRAFSGIKEEFNSLQAHQTAANTQVSQEGRAAIDTYLQATASNGQAPKPEVVKAIGKLQTVYDDITSKHGSAFTNDIILRTDFDTLDTRTLDVVAENIGASKLIPDDFSFTRSVELAQTGSKRISPKLNAVLNNITETGTTIKSFTKQLGELDLIDATPTELRDIANQVLGGKRRTSSRLTKAEAFELTKEIQSLKFRKENGASRTQLINQVKELQAELGNVKAIGDLDLPNYKKLGTKIRDFINDTPSFRDMGIKSLLEQTGKVKEDGLQALRFLQEANPTNKQLARFLDGDEAVLTELYEAALLNRDFKDSLTLKDAQQIVDQEIIGAKQVPEPRQRGQFEPEDITLKQDNSISETFLREETAQLEAKLSPEEIAEVDDFVVTQRSNDEALLDVQKNIVEKCSIL